MCLFVEYLERCLANSKYYVLAHFINNWPHQAVKKIGKCNFDLEEPSIL